MDKVQCYIDKQGEYRFRVRSQNGNIRSVSSEGYKNEEDCLKCLIATHEAIDGFLHDNAPIPPPLDVLKGCGLFDIEDEDCE